MAQVASAGRAGEAAAQTVEDLGSKEFFQNRRKESFYGWIDKHSS